MGIDPEVGSVTMKRGQLRPTGSSTSRATLYIIFGLGILCVVLLANYWSLSSSKKELQDDLYRLNRVYQKKSQEHREALMELEKVSGNADKYKKAVAAEADKLKDVNDQVKSKGDELTSLRMELDKFKEVQKDLENLKAAHDNQAEMLRKLEQEHSELKSQHNLEKTGKEKVQQLLDTANSELAKTKEELSKALAGAKSNVGGDRDNDVQTNIPAMPDAPQGYPVVNQGLPLSGTGTQNKTNSDTKSTENKGGLKSLSQFGRHDEAAQQQSGGTTGVPSIHGGLALGLNKASLLEATPVPGSSVPINNSQAKNAGGSLIDQSFDKLSGDAKAPELNAGSGIKLVAGKNDTAQLRGVPAQPLDLANQGGASVTTKPNSNQGMPLDADKIVPEEKKGIDGKVEDSELKEKKSDIKTDKLKETDLDDIKDTGLDNDHEDTKDTALDKEMKDTKYGGVDKEEEDGKDTELGMAAEDIKDKEREDTKDTGLGKDADDTKDTGVGNEAEDKKEKDKAEEEGGEHKPSDKKRKKKKKTKKQRLEEDKLADQDDYDYRDPPPKRKGGEASNKDDDGNQGGSSLASWLGFGKGSSRGDNKEDPGEGKDGINDLEKDEVNAPRGSETKHNGAKYGSRNEGVAMAVNNNEDEPDKKPEEPAPPGQGVLPPPSNDKRAAKKMTVAEEDAAIKKLIK